MTQIKETSILQLTLQVKSIGIYHAIICVISGDWHTAYLLLYGPRRLPKLPPKEEAEGEAEKKKEGEEAKTGEEKMETS